jgi:hypothetical protein
MKKIITLLTLAALCAGCSNSNDDDAKIAALSQKLDMVISNQTVISARLSIMPTDDGMVRMSNVYYTNTANSISSLKGEVFELGNMSQAQANMQGDVFSNEVDEATDIKNQLSSIQDRLDKIDSDNNNLIYQKMLDVDVRATMIEWDLTNPPPVGPLYNDLEQIKTRLGIPY